MRRKLAAILVCCLALATARATATTADAAGPLLVQEVLAASARHFPGILKSLAEQRVAEGKALEAAGAFDTVFSTEGFSRLDGFYDGRVADAKVQQPFREFGGSAYAGYGVSRGDFPIYEDEYYTSTGGQVKLGMLFSLLRDRTIDPRRFGVEDAQIALREAELDVLLTRVGVQRRALQAYWRWVAAGRQLGVYQQLLQLAIDREAGLKTQVADGSRAEIFLTENAQTITRRKSLVLTARRDFRMAALELAFYYRDANGVTLMPSPARLPGTGELAGETPLPEAGNESLSSALSRRPELLVIDAAMERARSRIALSENEMKPRLDLNLEYAYGLGDGGVGGPSRDSSDVIVGFTVSVPLERRQAEGRLAQARAKRESLAFEQQRLEDQIELELSNILLDLEVAAELAELADTEVAQAELMRQAEEQRFAQGASDFFLVTLREEAAANARIRHYAALRELRIARADYDAATVDVQRLGIASLR